MPDTLFILINLLTDFWLPWTFITVCGLSQVAVSGFLIAVTSVFRAQTPKCGLSICGTQAQLPHGMWNLPQQRSNPCPLHWLAGRFLTTGPPGKSPSTLFKYIRLGFLNPQPDLEEFISCRASEEQVLPAFILYVGVLWRPGCEPSFLQAALRYEMLNINEWSSCSWKEEGGHLLSPSRHQIPLINTVSQPSRTWLR